jgi:hypothetical protein
LVAGGGVFVAGGPRVFVGGGCGVRVAGAGLFAGTNAVGVRGLVGMNCEIESGTKSRGSGVAENRARVGVFVGVSVRVFVGVAEIRRVAVAVGEAVFVGWVAVGKGPRRACIVPKIAVLVLSTSTSCRPNAALPLKTNA